MTEYQKSEYDDKLVTMLEIIWGDGFLSPGGAEEVALLLSGRMASGRYADPMTDHDAELNSTHCWSNSSPPACSRPSPMTTATRPCA